MKLEHFCKSCNKNRTPKILRGCNGLHCPKQLTFETFLAQYRDNPRYELADGEVVDKSHTGAHETVSGKLATQIGIAIAYSNSSKYDQKIRLTALND